MKRLKVNLKDIESVKQFVTTTVKFPYPVDLKSGRYTIDAKSIMGILSLDLTKNLDLVVEDDDCQDYVDAIHAFVVE